MMTPRNEPYTPRRKKGRVVPFGYKVSDEDPKLLIPIPLELDCLREALFHLKTCSAKQVSNWLFKKTGRYISAVGLWMMVDKEKKKTNKAYYENRKAAALRRQRTYFLREQELEKRRASAQAKEEEAKGITARGES